MMNHGKQQENSTSMLKKVHYANDTALHELDEFIEDDDAELSYSIKHSGDAHSNISISTSILDDDGDCEVKRQIEDLQYKIKFLEQENMHINETLLKEKKRNTKLEEKLKFVKENQDVFVKLKEAYINMKYNEAAGRPIIEIRHKTCQTWEGVICSSCIQSEELRRQVNYISDKYKDMFIVSNSEMEQLLNTVKYLKDLISRREAAWASDLEREEQNQRKIALLEIENTKLKSVLDEKIQLNQHGMDSEANSEREHISEKILTEVDKLKKIISKYERAFRSIIDSTGGKYASPLNENELKIVKRIHKRSRGTKYYDARSRTPSEDQRCSSTLSDSGSEPCLSSKQWKARSKSAKNNDDSAIHMMDCLFDFIDQ